MGGRSVSPSKKKVQIQAAETNSSFDMTHQSESLSPRTRHGTDLPKPDNSKARSSRQLKLWIANG